MWTATHFSGLALISMCSKCCSHCILLQFKNAQPWQLGLCAYKLASLSMPGQDQVHNTQRPTFKFLSYEAHAVEGINSDHRGESLTSAEISTHGGIFAFWPPWARQHDALATEPSRRVLARHYRLSLLHTAAGEGRARFYAMLSLAASVGKAKVCQRHKFIVTTVLNLTCARLRLHKHR